MDISYYFNIYDIVIEILQYLNIVDVINLMYLNWNFLYKIGRSEIWLKFAKTDRKFIKNNKYKIICNLLENNKLYNCNIKVRNYYDEYYYFYKLSKIDIQYISLRNMFQNGSENNKKFIKVIGYCNNNIKNYIKLLRIPLQNLNKYGKLLDSIYFNLSDENNHIIVDMKNNQHDFKIISKIRCFVNQSAQPKYDNTNSLGGFFVGYATNPNININDYGDVIDNNVMWGFYNDSTTSSCERLSCNCSSRQIDLYFKMLSERIELNDYHILAELIRFIFSYM